MNEMCSSTSESVSLGGDMFGRHVGSYVKSWANLKACRKACDFLQNGCFIEWHSSYVSYESLALEVLSNLEKTKRVHKFVCKPIAFVFSSNSPLSHFLFGNIFSRFWEGFWNIFGGFVGRFWGTCFGYSLGMFTGLGIVLAKVF